MNTLKHSALMLAFLIFSTLVCFGKQLSLKKSRDSLPDSNFYNIGSIISLESNNQTREFVRLNKTEIWTFKSNNTEELNKQASFIIRKGFNGKEGYVSFESVSNPGSYLRNASFLLWLESNTTSKNFADDSSFKITPPLNGKWGFVSLQSYNYPNFYIIAHTRVGNRNKILSYVNDARYKDDSSFRFTPGLSTKEYTTDRDRYSGLNYQIGSKISFNSGNSPDQYFRNRNFELWVEGRQNTTDFYKDATFIVRKAWNGREGYVSFESVNYPGRFIRHGDFLLWIQEFEESDAFQEDSSFKITAPRNGRWGYISIQSSNYPDHYVTNEEYRGEISQARNEAKYNQTASWRIVAGLLP